MVGWCSTGWQCRQGWALVRKGRGGVGVGGEDVEGKRVSGWLGSVALLRLAVPPGLGIGEDGEGSDTGGAVEAA